MITSFLYVCVCVWLCDAYDCDVMDSITDSERVREIEREKRLFILIDGCSHVTAVQYGSTRLLHLCH